MDAEQDGVPRSISIIETSMRKLLTTLGLLLVSSQAFATYFVILKDGTEIRAKAKWTIVNGKAVVPLESGQTMVLDPNTIDVAKSEQTTQMGGGSVLNAGQQTPAAKKSQQSQLGAAFKLRKLPGADTTTAATATTPVIPAGPLLGPEVLTKFERAYENVGIFEHKLTATGANSLRAELTADNEEKVFNAISATSFLIVRNAGIAGAQIDMVELFMRTTTGGSSGRFQMTRDDANSLNGKLVTREEYFIRKVLY
jgi:hypothetical protein